MVLGDQDKLLLNDAEVLDCYFFGGTSTARVLCWPTGRSSVITWTPDVSTYRNQNWILDVSTYRDPNWTHTNISRALWNPKAFRSQTPEAF